jgi:hypothetical protein
MSGALDPMLVASGLIFCKIALPVNLDSFFRTPVLLVWERHLVHGPWNGV